MGNQTNISIPAPTTLAKYGLDVAEWEAMLRDQGYCCGVCGRVPNPSKRDGKVRLVIDHEHVRGWKAMASERRKLFVRGLTCWKCNTDVLARGVTVEKLEGGVRYLTAYLARRPK